MEERDRLDALQRAAPLPARPARDAGAAWGRILHITSFVAKQPIDLLTISSTLRAGISALTKTMSIEFCARRRPRQRVLPGHVLTDRQIHLNEIRSKEEGVSIEDYAARVERSIPHRALRGAARDRRTSSAFLAASGRAT